MSGILQIKETLLKSPTAFKSITEFSPLPGIYGIFYAGASINLYGMPLLPAQLIYIGKTESSQKQRDANTHFRSGKTGSSTLRKSLGALLREKLSLTPIPRSNSDIRKGRRSHFKFTDDSEQLLTEWMVNNLSISFYEHIGDVHELETIETHLISQLRPALNLAKNSNNPHGRMISRLRKMCAEIAFSGISSGALIDVESRLTYSPSNKKEGKMGLYSNFWKGQLSEIRQMISSGEIQLNIQLDGARFEALGNRKNYGFRIEYKNGMVVNNLGGSAVARDLSGEMDRDRELHALMATGNYVIKMGKDFKLVVENHNM